MGGENTSQSPLEHLKVLDFSRVLAGPFAGRMLADLGADVVKVEPPDGDVTRLWGRVVGNVPGYFHQQNVGKRNISIDLRHPDAAALVLEDYEDEPMGVYAVYAHRRYLSGKVRTFVDFLGDYFGSPPYWECG